MCTLYLTTYFNTKFHIFKTNFIYYANRAANTLVVKSATIRISATTAIICLFFFDPLKLYILFTSSPKSVIIVKIKLLRFMYRKVMLCFQYLLFF